MIPFLAIYKPFPNQGKEDTQEIYKVVLINLSQKKKIKQKSITLDFHVNVMCKSDMIAAKQGHKIIQIGRQTPLAI